MIEQYRLFPFPLNVYAHIVARGGGPLDYLHYGLFAPGCSGIAEAQAHSTRLALQQLPQPPVRILEVGTGLGTTLARLRELGYDASGVNPDPHQVAYAAQRHGLGPHIACCKWETFDAGGQLWDAILFQESSQYIAPADIFSRAARLLRPGGTLVILDEVGLRPPPPGETGLNLLATLLEAAAASGFTLQKRQDLSQLAAPTVDHLLRMTAALRDELRSELGVTAQQLDALDRSNEAYRQKYADGRYGYALLRFSLRQAPPN